MTQELGALSVLEAAPLLDSRMEEARYREVDDGDSRGPDSEAELENLSKRHRMLEEGASLSVA